MRALLIVAASGLVYVLALVWSLSRIPATHVPIHFGLSGQANNFVSRHEFITMCIVLGAIIIALAVGTCSLVEWIPPRRINVPNRQWWTNADQLPILRKMLARDLAVMFGLTLVAMSALPVGVALAVRTQPARLPAVVVGAFALCLAGAVAWPLWRARHHLRACHTRHRA